MSRSPLLGEALNAAVARGAAELRVALPGEIQSFDPATQLASVKPLLREDYETETGGRGVEALGVVNDVPVVFPGGGGFAQTWPVKQGDPCLLIICDRSLDRWIASGGDIDPIDVRRHDLSDAVAILGVRAKPGALSEFDSSRAVWGNKGPRIAADGSSVQLGVTNGEIATEAGMLGTKYTGDEAALFTNLAAQFTTLGAALATAAPAASAPCTAIALALNNFASAMATRLSTKVKLK